MAFASATTSPDMQHTDTQHADMQHTDMQKSNASSALTARFAALRREGRKALVCYVTAGPNVDLEPYLDQNVELQVA